MKFRKNYLAKFVKYAKKVFNVEHGFGKMKDERVNPKFKTSTVLLVVLIGLSLRVKSLNELNYMIDENEFKNLFQKRAGFPRIDTIRDTIKVTDVKDLHDEIDFIIKTAVRNKVFANGTIDGYTVAAVDGTKLFGSNKKSCPECLKNKGHNSHSCVAMAIVGNAPKLVVGFEMYKPKEDAFKKDEGEITAAKRLVTSMFERKNSFIDVLVYDSLMCNSIFISHCLRYDVNVIIRAKQNNNNFVRQAKRITNKTEPIEVWGSDGEFEKVEVFESEFNMPNVEQPLRFVKFAIKHLGEERTQIMLVTSCMDMELRTLFKIMRARADIENSIFNNLKKECSLGHLCTSKNTSGPKKLVFRTKQLLFENNFTLGICEISAF